MLYLIGIGLGDCKDITLKGLEAIKNSKYVYLESYTSLNRCTADELKKLFKKDIITANREFIEGSEELILSKAKNENVAVLVIGDPLSATTHISLILKAKEKGVKFKVIHNASIITAVGITGLELYKFGKITSIPFNNNNITAPIDVLKKNKSIGLHTLFLLDLDPLNKRFMTFNEAIRYLISKGVNDEIAIGCGALGTDDYELVAGRLNEIIDYNIKEFPQCLIIPGDLHFIEEEYLKQIWIRKK